MQGILDKVGGIASMFPMPIANAKHVHALPFLNIWCQYEGILVNLIGVSRLKPNSCCKGKLFYDVFLLDMGQMRCVRRCWPQYRSDKAKLNLLLSGFDRCILSLCCIYLLQACYSLSRSWSNFLCRLCNELLLVSAIWLATSSRCCLILRLGSCW